MIAMVLQEIDLELLPDQAIRPLPKITLRPNGPVRMVLHHADRGQATQRLNRYMVSNVKRAHPGTGLNNPVFFIAHRAGRSANGCKRFVRNAGVNSAGELHQTGIEGLPLNLPEQRLGRFPFPPKKIIAYRPPAFQRDGSTLMAELGERRLYLHRGEDGRGSTGRLSSCFSLGGRATSSS